MALTRIEYGALASSEVMNGNFEYLDNRISSVSETFNSNNAGIYSNISSINTLITQVSNKLRPLGQPIIRLDDTIYEDEIRLEGAEVSRTTYSELFSIYGITFGNGDGVNTFNLPDFRDRVFWGADNVGYLDAELPNISGSINALVTYQDTSNWAGVFNSTYSTTWKKAGVDQTLWQSNMNFKASNSSSVYKDGGAVRPNAVAVKVVTRYR